MKLSHFIAGCFGIVGFVLAILAGLYADNSFSTVLVNALLSSGACYIVGYVVGAMAQHVSDEHARRLADQVATLEQERAARKREEEAARQAEEEGRQAEAAAAATAATP